MADPVIPPVVNPTPDPNQVFSGTNVAQTMTAPLPAPDYSDPLKLRDYFYKSPEIEAERTALADLNKQLATLSANTRNQQNFIEDRTVPMDIIRGEQASQLRLSSAQQQALSEQQQVRQANLSTFLADADQRFNLAYQQRDQIQNLISQTGGKAGISFADSFETATAKATKYIEKKAKDDQKEAYKKELKAQLLALGKNTKGLSTKELEKKLRKYNKEAAAEAKRNADLDYQIKLKSLRGGSGGTVGQRTGAVVSAAQNALLASRGTDGKVDPGVYAQFRAQYASETGDVTGFDQQFGRLLSEQEQGNLGIQLGTAAQQTAAAKSEAAKQSAQYQASNALAAVNNLANMPGLSSAVGTISSKLPTFRGQTADFEREVERVKSLITLPELQNLRGLGAMSDREFATLSAAASSLNLNMSEEGFRRELGRIQETLGNAVNKAQTITAQQMSTIPVIDLQTGQYGTIPENEFDQSRYIRQ